MYLFSVSPLGVLFFSEESGMTRHSALSGILKKNTEKWVSNKKLVPLNTLGKATYFQKATWFENGGTHVDFLGGFFENRWHFQEYLKELGSYWKQSEHLQN